MRIPETCLHLDELLKLGKSMEVVHLQRLFAKHSITTSCETSRLAVDGISRLCARHVVPSAARQEDCHSPAGI